ncbi:MAG: T9SS type A sorting domain-containing protein [Urechidicola sp.]|nr:T9SS type A sorting domain-containing protein [Urechidicola sp.]
MKKIYLLLFTILITSTSFGQELLLNGDFEAWDDPTTPTSWTKAESTDQESVAANVHGDTYSAKHTGGTSDISQTVTGIIPGNDYTVTVWYKVDAGFGDGTDARIWSKWSNNGTLDNTTDASVLQGVGAGGYFDNNGNVWTEYTVTVTAPVTANEFYFEVRTYGSAVVYWDDFSLFAEAASSDPGLAISSPTEGSTILTDAVDVGFLVSNFDVANGTGDGHIHYTVDGGGTVMKYDTDPISLTGLSDGAHTVYMELVDNSHVAIAPAVNSTVNFTTNNILQSLPFYDSFDYPVGQTLGEQSIWIDNFSGDSPDIIAGNLSYSTLTGTGSSVSFAGSGADPTIDYTPTSSGKVFASFIMDVTDLSAFTTSGYFGVLRADDGQYRCKLWVDFIDASTYNIGVSSPSTLNVTTGPFNANTSIFVVMSYDLDADTVSAWVNPALGGVEPTADISEASGTTGVTLSQFMFRRDSAGETPGITVDELRVGTSWSDVAAASLSVARNDIEGFSVYPNPVNAGEFSIRSFSNLERTVQIYDMLGKQVYNKQVEANDRVQVSNLTQGIYILKVEEDGKTATRKLIIE